MPNHAFNPETRKSTLSHITSELTSSDFLIYSSEAQKHNNIGLMSVEKVNIPQELEKVDLISSKKKLLLDASGGIYGSIVYLFTAMANEISNNNSSDLIIILCGRSVDLGPDTTVDSRVNNVVYDFLKKYITDYGFKYIEVDLGKSFLYINNYYYVDMRKSDINYFYDMNKYAKQYLIDTNKTHSLDKKINKVYISRRNDVVKEYTMMGPDGTIIDQVYDTRLTDNEYLEKFLESHGFYILDLENFTDYIDQINFFSQVDVLIGSTGTGLINCVYMPKDSIVVEIFTTMYAFDYENARIIEEPHHMYYDANTSMGRTHISLQSDKTGPGIVRALEDIISIL